MAAIEVKDLRKNFTEKGKRVEAVKGISFEVGEGEIFGLLGPNGAGKSTTINILTGLLTADSGSVRLLGSDPGQVKHLTNVATAYHPLSESLTVLQNMVIYGMLYRISNPRQRAEELLKLFELSSLAARKINRLSSGENTRVSLCKGLLNRPRVLFLDECTVGLDPDIAEKTRRIIKDYQQSWGCSILFTSHYMSEVEELCDRVAFMKGGEIIRIDTPRNLTQSLTSRKITITVQDAEVELHKMLSRQNITHLEVQGKTITFVASTEQDSIYKVLNKVFTQGYRLEHLEIEQPTLEDIFIRIARAK